MSHFLKLPMEIRVMIYEYSLLTSNTINPYPTRYIGPTEPFTQFTTNTEDPTIGLLAVNTTIREEASPVFYGKNRLRVPWDAEHPSSLALWGKHNAHFRHVVMDFDSRGVVDADPPDLPPTFVHESKRHAQRYDAWLSREVHDRPVRDLLEKWQNKFRLLQDMKLKTLVVDLIDCRCPRACCRLVRKLCEEVLKRHLLPKGLRENPHRLFVIRLADVDVKFIGMVNNEEKVIVRSMGLTAENFKKE